MLRICPRCAKPMGGSKLGRNVFECPTYHEIVQLLKVIEVPDALPWNKSYCIHGRHRCSENRQLRS